MFRFLPLLIVLFFPIVLTGQTGLTSDTVRMKEIIIRRSSKPAVLNGFRDQTIDSSVLKDYPLDNLSAVLSENTPLFVRNYGPGASATTSFRGAGASHTQLLWNEISINSPMLGQADFSLVPAGFIDEIRILNGGASMIMGSGGLGGTVNFDTKPEWKNETNLKLNAGAGSFGTYSGIMKLRTGTEKFQSVTRGYLHSSVNNFKYLNDAAFSTPVIEKRSNAAVSMNDIMQEFYYRGDRSVTSASFWYSSSNRQLPSNMLVIQLPGSERQEDESFRAVISHDRNLNKASVETSIAWFSDRLLYINKPAAIYSTNHSNTLFARIEAETPIGARSRLKIVLNNEMNLVNSVNYSDFKKRDIYTISATDRTLVGQNLGFSLLVRDIIDNGKFLFPDISTGADLMLLKNREAYIRMNFSRNSKVPSMNDLYWNPGGNPDLKNEYSYSGELSFDMKYRISETVELRPDITIYSAIISDMIQWLPGENSYWSPRNISKVNTTGAETGLNVDLKKGDFLVRFKLLYTISRAHEIDNKNNTGFRQLIYVPKDQAAVSIRIDYRDFYTTLLTDLTGKRFTEPDNSKSLPAYLMNSVITGFRLKTGSNSFNFCAKAENILNVHYQIIAYYPMPGRSFTLSVTYNFIK